MQIILTVVTHVFNKLPPFIKQSRAEVFSKAIKEYLTNKYVDKFILQF